MADISFWCLVLSHYLNKWLLHVNQTFRHKLQWNFTQTIWFTSNKMHCKMLSAKCGPFCSLLNSSPPGATYMRHWTGSSLVQVMACRLFGAKPLPEPMLVYCQLDSWEQVSVKLESEFYHFQTTKCIWKCCLPKWQPFCPGGDELMCGLTVPAQRVWAFFKQLDTLKMFAMLSQGWNCSVFITGLCYPTVCTVTNQTVCKLTHTDLWGAKILDCYTVITCGPQTQPQTMGKLCMETAK